MRTRKEKEKPVSNRKQKQPEVREVSLVDGCGRLWWKRFSEKIHVMALSGCNRFAAIKLCSGKYHYFILTEC